MCVRNISQLEELLQGLLQPLREGKTGRIGTPGWTGVAVHLRPRGRHVGSNPDPFAGVLTRTKPDVLYKRQYKHPNS